MNKFKVNFQADKVHKLWLTLSDKGYLCFDKITNVNVNVKTKKKNENMPFNSRARIETALYRIEDTLNYMNTIPLGANPQRLAAFDFYDFICIKKRLSTERIRVARLSTEHLVV